MRAISQASGLDLEEAGTKKVDAVEQRPGRRPDHGRHVGRGAGAI